MIFIILVFGNVPDIQGVSFKLPAEKCEVSSLGHGLELPGLGLGFYDEVSVSVPSRNFSQVSVSEVTFSTTSME